MGSQDFRFVVVGSGNISRTYIDAVSRVQGSEVVGLVSRSGSRPEHVARLPVFMSISAAAASLEFEAVAGAQLGFVRGGH